DVEGTVANLTSKDIAKEQTEVARRQFELDPTQERYKTYSKLRSAGYDVPLMRLPADEEAQDIATSRVDSQIRAKQKQRRKFMDYLAKQPTSLGGTVGDLPYDLQKQIASQYSRNDRRTMMDRMDREANNGKQK